MGKDILYPLRRLHGVMVEAKLRWELRNKYLKEFKEKRKGNPKTVFLIMTPEHGNLGDHAIAQAEVDLLATMGVDYVEITGWQLEELRRNRLLGMMNGYPILLQGGGYLGTLWFGSEQCLREVILKNPRSQIVLLPNTIYYEDSPWGKAEFERSVEIYNRHRKLLIFARERTSYGIMADVYRNVKLVPDVVLSLNHTNVDVERKGCLICLRSDCEKTMTADQYNLVLKQAEGLFGNDIIHTDMVVKRKISPAERKQALLDKFRQFSAAELVVTDRLHGMIFCAITGTPCVVLDSKSPKVRGCYEWIKDLPYIRFADSVSHIAQEYNQIPKAVYQYDGASVQPYYEKLSEDILSVL